MRTLDQIVAADRITRFREAIVAGLAAEIGVAVHRHEGKLDMSDVLAGETFVAPSIHVGASRIEPADVATGVQDLVVHCVAYVVAEEKMVAGRLAYRDEIGWALANAVLAVLNDDHATRWGLAFVTPAEDQKAAPLFTSKTFAKGTVYYAVTWRQTILADYETGAPPPPPVPDWSDQL